MRSASPRSAVAAAAAVGFVVLAACTAGGAEPTPSGTAGALGPLEQLLGSAAGGSIDVTAPDAATQWIAHLAKQENLIAACMNAEGFDYVPEVPAVDDVKITTEGLDRASREYALQYGFGIAHQPAEVGEVAVAAGTAGANWIARQAMSEAERDAWDTALSGPVTKREVDAQGSESVTRSGGCRDLVSDGGYPVADAANDFLASMAQDGAFDELDNEWSACMHESGFEHESPTAANNAFSDEYVAMLDDHSLENDDVAGLAEREIDVAVASWDCKAETDYEARFRAIRDQVQQAWIDEHRAELDEWLAAMAEQ